MRKCLTFLDVGGDGSEFAADTSRTLEGRRRRCWTGTEGRPYVAGDVLPVYRTRLLDSLHVEFGDEAVCRIEDDGRGDTKMARETSLEPSGCYRPSAGTDGAHESPPALSVSSYQRT